MSDLETPREVQRWEANGGTWEVDPTGGTLARILLRRCDGGEIVDVIETADEATVRWAQQQVRG
ncbi:MAG: hypothetical protein ACTHXA_11505 [Gulosibacter sp.]|uniref:hypothetical protein n=1 Tax=Gulosibacter sp. TaxID=2817531 RepID=UPI003F906EA2